MVWDSGLWEWHLHRSTPMHVFLQEAECVSL